MVKVNGSTYPFINVEGLNPGTVIGFADSQETIHIESKEQLEELIEVLQVVKENFKC